MSTSDLTTTLVSFANELPNFHRTVAAIPNRRPKSRDNLLMYIVAAGDPLRSFLLL